ncbi:F-box only protein 40-like [Nelusetta ayraudi]|uniref:F-box only protein 40-like n=1 Tax=Nelusetta ayraudi TaxID=303726 RepID=UPI003F71B10B
MSHRSRASRGRHHVHCDSCYSRRCRARVEASVCCAVIPCRLHCGALFHLCKEDDHLLLCPNVKVPCLNVQYGCPLHLPRSSQAAHLQVCPASVVCCSMEWNRWPANDAHSFPNAELHENLLREREQDASLDLVMALKDQDRLFHSMKMRKLFPELVKSVEEEEKEEERIEEEKRREKWRKEAERAAAKEASCHTWESFTEFDLHRTGNKDDEDEDELANEPELTQEEREALARASEVNIDLLVNYNAWERMFSMEMGGCRESEGAAQAGREQGGPSKGRGKPLAPLTEEEEEEMGPVTSKSCRQPNRAGVAPLTSSLSCVRVKNFDYGHIEPMKIVTVRTFKIPTSFAAKQSRIRNPGFYKRESQAVDTSDLGVVPEEMPVWEEVQASLLCSLETEQRGHLIAESLCTDGLLHDVGTQTYSFLSAPFRRNTSLADLMATKPLELHLQLQVESVTSRHHKASSAFTFLCGHTFQRREYASHYKNAHSDIQMGVNGWFEQRCPLAYLGCTYSQRRFRPSTHDAYVNFHEDLGCFSLHPTIPFALAETSQQPTSSVDTSSSAQATGREGGGETGGVDWLSLLPFEVLCHMAAFLDSLSLSQLALVSRFMRQVCSSLLQDRGMVTLHWEKKTYSHGGAKWRVKQKVWRFSTLFSPVDKWCFQQLPSMSEHLQVCPHYERESRTEKVALPQVRQEAQNKSSCKGPTLVNLFQQKRIMM